MDGIRAEMKDTEVRKKWEKKKEKPLLINIPLSGLFLAIVVMLLFSHCKCNRHTRSDGAGEAEKSSMGAKSGSSSHEGASDDDTVGNGRFDNDNYKQQRKLMVTRQIRSRGVKDQRVLDAMRNVKRHLFVPEKLRGMAYSDRPLPIGENQTISQPFIVAFMTQVLGVGEGDKVLEIGTGSGYQVAVLARVVKEVYTIEIVESLAKRARKLLEKLGYKNINFKIGDGYKGWPEAAPFDGIMVTAAPNHVPKPLLEQLKVGGKLVIPVKNDLLRITRTKEGFKREKLLGVRFVPMTGEARKR